MVFYEGSNLTVGLNSIGFHLMELTVISLDCVTYQAEIFTLGDHKF